MELLHRRCCGLDVHKEKVVACLRLVSDGEVTREVRTFETTAKVEECFPHNRRLLLGHSLGGQLWTLFLSSQLARVTTAQDFWQVRGAHSKSPPTGFQLRLPISPILKLSLFKTSLSG
jgi:hypothetical protein